MEVVKFCISCGDEFHKRPKDSKSQWENRRFCSMLCKNKYDGAVRTVPIEERFWRFVSKKENNDCWEWHGSNDGKGYGHIMRETGRSPAKAYRVSYEMHKGPIPKGLIVRHECDNPKCVNPGHLILGTHKDNSEDMVKRGRQNKKSLLNLNHEKKLDQQQIEEIKLIKFRALNGRGPGELMSDVAKTYNVCSHTIRKIKQNNY